MNISPRAFAYTTLLWCAAAAAQQELAVPSLDRNNGQAVVLPAVWFAAGATTAKASAPALVLLHGCGGNRDKRGQLGQRYTELAARLNTMGVHALVIDSLTPRGETELCTQKTGSRKVTQVQRRRDALGALQWLAAQPGVDPTRIGLLGWSNGGSTVLAATNLRHAEVAAAAVQPTLAVAFYPGCEAELARGHSASAPLLMLLGEADDWTPAAPCKALAAAASAQTPTPTPMPLPQWHAYAGAYHGFDGTAPVRLRADVPNGVNPGAGVHVGANPAARAAAQQDLESFIRLVWKLVP
jgi:dienelactone hydrolase